MAPHDSESRPSDTHDHPSLFEPSNAQIEMTFSADSFTP
jgi:hypothetical protein